MPSLQEIQEALTPILRLIVTNPQAMTVDIVVEGHEAIIRVTASPADIGRLIGMQGRTARSLRTVLQAISMQSGTRVKLDIVRGSQSAISE